MISIVDFGSSKTNHIAHCLNQLNYDSKISKWDASETTELEKASAIILSGAPILITETNMDNYLQKYLFLKAAKIPVLGICFGHQLLGLLHDAKAFKGNEVRKEIEISILTKSKLFEDFDDQIKMQEDHTEGILLPRGFVHLASSEKYEIEAMKHPVLNMFGVQFHPEVSGNDGLKLLNNFCKLIYVD